MKSFRIRHLIGLEIVLLVLFLSAPVATAMPEYSLKTGEGCRTCHVAPEGGALTEKGLQYAASGYRWPPAGGYRLIGAIRKPVRLFIGFLHMTASFLWFGTILYVHLLLRPGYASKGLPRGEVIMGIASMTAVGITGLLLTISKINSPGVLVESAWGKLLSVKMALYLIMVSSAAVAVTVVGPKLRRGAGKKAVPPKSGVYDPVTLSSFDGKEGRPSFIAYKEKVYDVSGLKLWRGGAHMKHSAGEDLTQALPKAPHGEEKLDSLKAVGSFDASRKPHLAPAQRAFYIIAYLNLGLVFAVLGVLAFWRWGI